MASSKDKSAFDGPDDTSQSSARSARTSSGTESIGSGFSNTDFYEDPFSILDEPDSDQIFDPKAPSGEQSAKSSLSRSKKESYRFSEDAENTPNEDTRTFLQKHFVIVVGGGVAAIVFFLGFLQFAGQFSTPEPEDRPVAFVDGSVDVTAPVRIMQEGSDSNAADMNTQELEQQADFGAFFDLEGADLRERIAVDAEPSATGSVFTSNVIEAEVSDNTQPAQPLPENTRVNSGILSPDIPLDTQGSSSARRESSSAIDLSVVDASSEAAVLEPQNSGEKRDVMTASSPAVMQISEISNNNALMQVTERLEGLESRLLQIEAALTAQREETATDQDVETPADLMDLEERVDARLAEQREDIQAGFTRQATRIEMALGLIEDRVMRLAEQASRASQSPPAQAQNGKEPSTTEQTVASGEETIPESASTQPSESIAQRPEHQNRWTVQAASPGQAWITRSGEARLQLVKPGERVAGLGTILGIEQTPSGWVVIGTQGRITPPDL